MKLLKWFDEHGSKINWGASFLDGDAIADLNEALIEARKGQQEPTEEMIQKGAYILSECLNDNAPLGQKVYEGPARLAYIAMLEVALK